MAPARPRYSKEEFARRGDEIYERDIRPHWKAEDEGKFVAIDIETGAYEIDADELTACDRLCARIPDAQGWLVRVGSPYVYHLWSRAFCFDHLHEPPPPATRRFSFTHRRLQSLVGAGGGH